ncbi:MAG: hypothetical protein KDC73_00765 [Ignavibacteriae bacterium]|nr:hypothetical protein [Ignavibacteriota bacterium]MCB9243050.1 hypothetical protein [Ignavibacteriales bacterium]
MGEPKGIGYFILAVILFILFGIFHYWFNKFTRNLGEMVSGMFSRKDENYYPEVKDDYDEEDEEAVKKRDAKYECIGGIVIAFIVILFIILINLSTSM